MPAHSIAVVINPVSGARRGRGAARERAARASAFLGSRGGDPALVFVTERRGHARELAAAAVARGISTVVAWGGDGTMNEVASALAFTSTALGLVPSGSGNGLARELRIPFDPAAALDVAHSGAERVIDAGEIAGRYFFNIAGVGLDARVAHRFAADGGGRRGLSRYVALTLRELRGYAPQELTVTTASSAVSRPVLLVAIANGRQYGNGALIAPRARLDDGRLDVVVVGHRSLLRACVELPFVFLGRADSLGGVTMEAVESVEVRGRGPLLYHLDGEAVTGSSCLRAASRPGALRVKVPHR